MSQFGFTAGLDLGDKHTHVCVLDTASGEVWDYLTSVDTLSLRRRRRLLHSSRLVSQRALVA